MLQERGAKDVDVRAAVIALAPGHPYLRLPVQFATSLKNRILDAGLMSKSELDETIGECERGGFEPPNQWDDIRRYASPRTQAGVTLTGRRGTCAEPCNPCVLWVNLTRRQKPRRCQ